MPFCARSKIDLTNKPIEYNTSKEAVEKGKLLAKNQGKTRMETEKQNGFSDIENRAPPTYEEAFPPLGSPTAQSGPDSAFPLTSAVTNASYGRSQSSWPVKSIPSSSVTQVCCVYV